MHKHQTFFKIIIIIYVNYSISKRYVTLKMTTHGTDVIPYIKVYHCQFLEEISMYIWRKYFEREG